MARFNTFHIINFGCKLNIYEAESISYLLKGQGLNESKSVEDADIVIINTCTVTSKADSKCRNAIRKTRRQNDKTLLIVCGCLVNTDLDTLLDFTEVDVFLENKDKDKILNILEITEKGEYTPPLVFQSDLDGSFNFTTHKMLSHSRAFLKIQDGCDNYCSYCKIPYARGKNRSRNWQDILADVAEIAGNGYKEVVLTGINVGSYNYEGVSFAGLLKKIVEECEHIRVRISSIEPQYVDDRFIEILKHPRICAHLHIALQNGSDRVLALMNRKYDSARYRELVERVRAAKPGLFLSTDLILGFPGESDADFAQTRDFVLEMKFSYIHLFGYSPRKGTAAVDMSPKVPERVRDERVQEMNELVKDCNYSFREGFLGKELAVLIETERDGFYYGKSENYITIKVKSEEPLQGKEIYKVRVTAVDELSTEGECC